MKPRAILILVSLLMLGVALSIWATVADIRKIRAMCDEIVPSMTIAEVRATIQPYGVRDMWADSATPGIRFSFNRTDAPYTWMIMSWMPLNRVTCDVEHDGQHVVTVSTSS